MRPVEWLMVAAGVAFTVLALWDVGDHKLAAVIAAAALFYLVVDPRRRR